MSNDPAVARTGDTFVSSTDERLRILLESVPDSAILFLDADARIVVWSVGATRVFGYDASEVLGRSVSVLYPAADGEDDPPGHEMELAARESPAPEASERWYVGKDGTRFLAGGIVRALRDATGTVCGYCKVVHGGGGGDSAVAGLPEDSRAFLAASVHCSADAVIGMTLDTERILTWNPAAERLYGWRAEEIVGQPFAILVPPEARDEFEDHRKRLASGTVSSVVVDTQRLRRDGSSVDVNVCVSVVRADAGSAVCAGAPIGLCAVARDITERRRSEAERTALLERHAHVSGALQQSLLMVPPPDSFPGIAVKPHYEPAYDDTIVGGDFFDFAAVEENRIALVIGDVTGKGLDAAVYTAEIKYALRAYLREAPIPAIALERLNNFVYDTDRLGVGRPCSTYVAAACLVLNTETGELISSSAGMESPFVVSAATGRVTELPAGGLLMGVEPHTLYETQRLTMERGDLLVMTTDGTIDARAPSGEHFGPKRLMRAAIRPARSGLPLSAIADSMIRRIKRFVGAPLRDDVCLLLARRL